MHRLLHAIALLLLLGAAAQARSQTPWDTRLEMFGPQTVEDSVRLLQMRKPLPGRSRDMAAIDQEAACGSAAARLFKGLVQANGIFGVPADRARGLDLILDSAQSGYGYGMYLLGLLYFRGQLTRKDDVEAAKWIALALADLPKSEDLRHLVGEAEDLQAAIQEKLTPEQKIQAETLASAFRPARLAAGDGCPKK